MESPNKLLSTLDKFLLAGLGCGVMLLCAMIGVLYYLWENPPRARSLSPALTGVPTAALPPTEPGTLPAADVPTPAFTPTPDQALFPTLVSSPVPNFGESLPPSGKIVFTCYIKQIDQICLMNADGSGRRQITDLQATAFYASLSPDGETVYFSSRQSGSFEIYSVRVNGNKLQRLTNGIGSLYAPELSPDGARIVFTNEASGKQGLWVMDIDGHDR